MRPPPEPAGFPLTLLQRGYLVLHASAASVDGKAAAFLGMPGAGKSSLAAALYQIGHTILVDDVTAVDLKADPISIIPAFPQIKLDMESAESLGIDLKTLILLDEDEEKRGLDLLKDFPAPISHYPKSTFLPTRGIKFFNQSHLKKPSSS